MHESTRVVLIPFSLVAKIKLTPKLKLNCDYLHMNFKTILANMLLVTSYAKNCAIVCVIITKMNKLKVINKQY